MDLYFVQLVKFYSGFFISFLKKINFFQIFLDTKIFQLIFINKLM